jgi:hypothetical protein
VTTYKVTVIVDGNFGERLAQLPADEPVWIIESEANTPVVQRLWKASTATDHLTGITIFQAGEGLTPEEQFLAQLDTIDLHHGEYSAAPPYSVLEVIGCEPSDGVAAALHGLGFRVDTSTREGFVASQAAATQGSAKVC